jgi:hypothetical protein
MVQRLYVLGQKRSDCRASSYHRGSYEVWHGSQYDHEVYVTAIGTNHLPIDATYYDDDVLYFDDHGGYALVGNNLNKGNPAIPYGAGSDNNGCTPYNFGYTFGSLAQTRKGAVRVRRKLTRSSSQVCLQHILLPV